MMRLAAAFALFALTPAALGAPQPPAAARLTVLVCGEETGRTIDLPTRPPTHEREQCPKACHAGCSRKRVGERPA